MKQVNHGYSSCGICGATASILLVFERVFKLFF